MPASFTHIDLPAKPQGIGSLFRNEPPEAIVFRGELLRLGGVRAWWYVLQFLDFAERILKGGRPSILQVAKLPKETRIDDFLGRLFGKILVHDHRQRAVAEKREHKESHTGDEQNA